ncbi:MAG: CRISPR-associated protein Cmr6 [Actinomycetota bacterium]|nr:CRISPR-associated protein Cmr6 [Actinomycetota bacterium]
MNWPWRMPRDLPWATPYPLPRDTSEALLAEGHCENFGLLMERYLAFGDNRGQLQIVRELTDRKALVPDFTGQGELIEAYCARWQQLAEELGAVTLSGRPHWRVIVGLGTNAVLGGGIVLHPVFGLPVIPATALKGISRAYARWVLERPEDELDALLGKVDEEGALRGDLLFLEGVPAAPPVVERDVINPLFGAYYRDGRTPPANYLSPQPIFFLALGARSLYRFGVASLSGDQEAVEQGARWLRGALTDLGIGAKTGAGYGYWELD